MDADDTQSLWREGEIVDGRYKVVRLAGRGQMGEVYQVRHLQWVINLAVKIPRTDLPLTLEELGQFEKEARDWVSLGLHPNVCSCYFVRQMAGIPVVFAEYVPDESLRHWIKDRRLYEGSAADAACRIVDVAIQFAWGLAHAHQQNLVHQDVKPANVLIDLSDGDLAVKITDFGLARAGAGRRVMVAGSSDDGATTPSIVLSLGGLTPAYASPEQAEQAKQGQERQAEIQPLSESTDIYSYAVSLLEVITGKLQWDVGSDALRALANYRASAPLAGMLTMPPEFVSLLEWCLVGQPPLAG